MDGYLKQCYDIIQDSRLRSSNTRQMLLIPFSILTFYNSSFIEYCTYEEFHINVAKQHTVILIFA